MWGLACLRFLRLDKPVLEEMVDDYDQVLEKGVQVFIAMYLTNNNTKADIPQLLQKRVHFLTFWVTSVLKEKESLFFCQQFTLV